MGEGTQRHRFTRFGTEHAVAVVAGLVTALLLLVWTRGQEDLTAIVVAQTQIGAGTTIEAGELTVIDVPAGTPINSVMVSSDLFDSVVGQVASRAIGVGEPLLVSDLRPVTGDDGRRAMSFALPASNAVGGDLAAGDIVDVLVVYDDSTRFVAETVPVLAVPDSVGAGLVTTTGGWWVTLAVEDSDALEIADGVERGTVYLLRSTGTPDLTIRELSPPYPGGETAKGESGQ